MGATGVLLASGGAGSAAPVVQVCVFLRVHNIGDIGLSVLTRVRLSDGGVERVGTLGYRIDAIGNAQDGLSYGLASRGLAGQFADGAHVIRVDLAGAVSDLGPVRAGSVLVGATAGAIVGDHLVVRAGGNLHAIDVNPRSATYLRLVRTTALRPADLASTVDDFDLRPSDGMLYGVTYGRVVRIDPRSGDVSIVSSPKLPDSRAYGAALIGPDGALYAAGDRSDGRSRLYRIGLNVGAAVESIAAWVAVDSSDATGCVSTPHPPPQVSPPPAVARPSITTRQPTSPTSPATPAGSPIRTPVSAKRLVSSAPPFPDEPPVVVPPVMTPPAVAPAVARAKFRSHPTPQAARDADNRTQEKRRWGIAVIVLVMGSGAAASAHGRRR
jgi:hypothetical protein